MSASAKKRTTVRTTRQQLAAVGFLRLLGDYVPQLSLPIVEWLWQTPRRYPRPDREIEALRSSRPFRIPLGTHALSGWTWGDSGPTILLVHGWEGRGSQLFGFVKPLRDAGYRVVTFDGPAHGDSPGKQASMFSMADGISAVSRVVGPLHGIIAHSGGAPATCLALHAGLRVPNVTLIAPGDPSLVAKRFQESVGLSTHLMGQFEDYLLEQYGLSIRDFSAERLTTGLQTNLHVVRDTDDRFAGPADALGYLQTSGGTLSETTGLGHHRILRDPSLIEDIVTRLGPAPPYLVQDRWQAAAPRPSTTDVLRDEVMADLDFGRD